MRSGSEMGDTMQYKLQKIPGRLLSIAGLALLAFTAGSLLTSNLSAQPPNPPPPLNVREQNLDAQGFIKVHEQGTSDVTGIVAVSGGSIAVTNLPSTLIVHPAPVGGALAFHFNVDTTLQEPFATINATAIHISAGGAEAEVWFQSPLSGLTLSGIPNVLLRYDGRDGGLRNFSTSFPQPVPLNGMRIICLNESFTCSLTIAVIGTSQ